MYIGICDLTTTKLLKKPSLRRQQHLKLAQAALERSQASSMFIDESV